MRDEEDLMIGATIPFHDAFFDVRKMLYIGTIAP